MAVIIDHCSIVWRKKKLCFLCRFLRPQASGETAQPQRKRLPKQDLQIWWALFAHCGYVWASVCWPSRLPCKQEGCCALDTPFSLYAARRAFSRRKWWHVWCTVQYWNTLSHATWLSPTIYNFCVQLNMMIMSNVIWIWILVLQM